MHSQNSILVFALYFLIATVVLLSGRLFFLESMVDARASKAATGIDERPEPTGIPLRPRSNVSQHALTDAKQQLIVLQQSLERTTELLARRTDMLHQREAERNALRKELDESIGLVINLVSAENVRDGSTLGPQGLRLEEDLAKLQTELQRSSQMHVEQDGELEELRQSLLATEADIVDMRTSAEQEILAMATEHAAINSAVRDTLRELGATATPALLNRLNDPRSTVRGWAATELGALGLDAAAAQPALIDLLTDPEEDVRIRAAEALTRIVP